MSQELHYTSVARGLKPGSRGFGTVAVTANLPEALADRLEALSAYEAVYPPGDPSAALNPVAYVHVRVTVGGYVQDVLSRIGPAGLDYSGRPNKYAHHVVLEPEERPEGGPAWLLGQSGFVRESWEGEPRILEEGPSVPQGDRPAAVARAWHELTGDAGWAGVLAEAFLADPRRPVFLVFRAGVELLPLFAEAIALLPASRRWDVEFSTYLTTLPPGLSCTWRGVLEGSAQWKAARRLPNALILDLRRPLGRAEGGGLVHLARTGERPEADEAVSDGPPEPPRLHGPPAVVRSGPPPERRASRHATGGEAGAGRDRLPDLAVRIEGEQSLLGGRPALARRRPRSLLAAILIAACVLPVLGAALLSPSLRRRIGLESPGVSTPVVERTRPVVAAAPPGKAKVAPPVEETKEGAEPSASTVPAPKPSDVAAKPSSPAPRPVLEPVIVAFATPEVPRSSLGATGRQDRAIRLPEDTDDRLEILNGAGFRLNAIAGVPRTWDVATRTGSGLGGGFALARLSHNEAPSWQFEWTRNAKVQSSAVEGLKDAILGLNGRDGRPIYVLLRAIEPVDENPLVVWKDQRLLFDRPDPRIRSVEWSRHPEALEGSRWKPRIRRWRVVVSRSGADADEDASPRRVLEPGPLADEKASAAGPELGRDLVPGEVRLELAIDPSRPGSINVRIVPDEKKLPAGREERAGRLDELKNATPRAKDGKERDPIAYRRGRLAELRENARRNGDAIQAMEHEIAELERIEEIRVTEDLLTRPARLELSVVIGLDVEGPGILEIARVGAFAGGR